MVDINITQGQGISQALAEYAKEVNGGKSVKLNKKQWQSIMSKISEINSKRNNESSLYKGDSNIFGNVRGNFVVHQGKLSFTDEEMNIILKEMGLENKNLNKALASEMQITGLSIEKQAPAKTPVKNKEMNPVQEQQTVKSAENKVATNSPAINTPVQIEKPTVNLSETAAKPELLQTPALNIPRAAAPDLANGPKPVKAENAQVKPAELTVPEELPSLSVNTAQKPETIAKEELAAAHTRADNKPKESVTDSDKTYLESGENFNFYSDGKIKSLDLNIKNLDWSRSGRKEWNQNHQLITDDLDNMMVKNSSGKVIANYHEGKYYIGPKEVSFEKFQKFAAKKGDIISMNYAPDIKVLDNRKDELGSIVKPKLKDLRPENLSLTDLAAQISKPQDKKFTKRVLTPEFYDRVGEIAKKINCNPAELLAVMNSESGLVTTAKNRHTGATGLIQFMPETAKGLGTSIEELSNMSELQQLNYVEKFLVNAKRAYIKDDRALSAGDLYGLIFMPAKSGQEILAVKGTKAYRQNRGLDYDGDGVISRRDLESHVNTKHVDVKFRT